jgi:hypothetical protein
LPFFSIQRLDAVLRLGFSQGWTMVAAQLAALAEAEAKDGV